MKIKSDNWRHIDFEVENGNECSSLGTNPRPKMDNNTLGSVQKDDQGIDESLPNLEENRDMSGENGTDYSESKSKKLVRSVSPFHALQVEKGLIKDSFHPSKFYSIGNIVPRHVVTLDEKYLRRCLELIRVNSAKEAVCNISANLSSIETGILSDGLNSTTIRDDDSCDLGRFVFDCPLAVETGEVVIRPVVSLKPGSQSVANILKSPLLRKVGELDVDQSSNDVERSITYNFMSSPGGFSNYSSHKLGSETPLSENHDHRSKTVQKRLFSVSSTNSTCSNHSSPSTSTISRGMLQCTWKDGIPYFVFSADNRREVYVAHLSKEGSARGKGPDHIYLFHSTKGGHKEHEISDDESRLVGKMNVSTSFSICPQGSKIMETEFVLFSGNEAFNPEMQTPIHNRRKSKGLPKKLVEVFKSSYSSKPRMMSRFQSNSIMEDSSSSPCQDTLNDSDLLNTENLLEEELSPNLESTAIVVRNHLPKNPLPEVGGWGLKFLSKAGVKQNVDTPEASVPCACSTDTGDCSTSTEILVPAGNHGGPRNGGPSNLIERWRSGGHCDCGGWDLGCPLTVLKARSSKEHCLPSTNTSGACKLFEFFTQGSRQCSPTLRIENVHGGLYFIHFQSTLSVLQSFAIAVSCIHAQSPTFRRKNIKQSR